MKLGLLHVFVALTMGFRLSQIKFRFQVQKFQGGQMHDFPFYQGHERFKWGISRRVSMSP